MSNLTSQVLRFDFIIKVHGAKCTNFYGNFSFVYDDGGIYVKVWHKLILLVFDVAYVSGLNFLHVRCLESFKFPFICIGILTVLQLSLL